MNLPGIVVTGASGFVGRNFLEAAAGKYRLFCLARRSQKEAGIPQNDNIRWTQVDIARWETMRDVVRCIKDHGDADYVLHLAGYYDFSNTKNPEYDRTNVLGTRNVLKLAQMIGPKRVLFASSLAACEFPPKGKAINEDSPVDAQFPYAISKREGEKLMYEFSEWFPVSIIRFAAVFSDWCEYPPQYMFLTTWLSKKWNARVVGGRGESAIPYIHIRDLNRLFFRIIEKSNDLPRTSVYLASPNGSVSHKELFTTATRYFYGQDVKPVKIPKFLATPGVMMRQSLGQLTQHKPFERLWMMEYIDRKLTIDATRTYRELGWEPTPRYTILRRTLFMIENMKSHAGAWHLRNEEVLLRVAQRPNLVIHELMVKLREELIEQIMGHILAPERSQTYRHYHEMDRELLEWHITLVYQLIATGIRTRSRLLLKNYAQIISYRRYVQGFSVDEVRNCMNSVGEIISAALNKQAEIKNLQLRVYDYVTMTIQLAVDQIEDSFEWLTNQSPESVAEVEKKSILSNSTDLERIIRELEDICQDNPIDAYLSTGGIDLLKSSG